MRGTHSHLTIGTIAATFIRQVFSTLSNLMKDAAPQCAAQDLSGHLRYDIGDLDMRPRSDKRQAAQDLHLLRSP